MQIPVSWNAVWNVIEALEECNSDNHRCLPHHSSKLLLEASLRYLNCLFDATKRCKHFPKSLYIPTFQSILYAP